MTTSRLVRCSRWFTPDELVALARTLAELERLKRVLLGQLNGRVYVAWIDPLLSFGKATKFYGRLRSELENEWYRIHGPDEPNPFFGRAWDDRVGATPIDAPDAERWKPGADA